MLLFDEKMQNKMMTPLNYRDAGPYRDTGTGPHRYLADQFNIFQQEGGKDYAPTNIFYIPTPL